MEGGGQRVVEGVLHVGDVHEHGLDEVEGHRVLVEVLGEGVAELVLHQVVEDLPVVHFL